MEGQLTAQSQTFGEKAVGLSFNPGGDENVNKVKALYAQIIDLMVGLKPENCTIEEHRLVDISIMEAQTAQMWAVKAITWK